MACEHPHLAAAVDGGGGRGQHLDGDVRGVSGHGVGLDEMAPFGAKEHDVRLHDVELVEHDVERCDQGDPTGVAPVLVQQQEGCLDRHLVAGQR